MPHSIPVGRLAQSWGSSSVVGARVWRGRALGRLGVELVVAVVSVSLAGKVKRSVVARGAVAIVALAVRVSGARTQRAGGPGAWRRAWGGGLTIAGGAVGLSGGGWGGPVSKTVVWRAVGAGSLIPLAGRKEKSTRKR